MRIRDETIEEVRLVREQQTALREQREADEQAQREAEEAAEARIQMRIDAAVAGERARCANIAHAYAKALPVADVYGEHAALAILRLIDPAAASAILPCGEG